MRHGNDGPDGQRESAPAIPMKPFLMVPKAIHQTGLLPGARLVYAYIRERIGDDAIARVSVPGIARSLKLSKPTVLRAVDQIGRQELLEVIRGRKGQGNRYSLPRGSTASGCRMTPPESGVVSECDRSVPVADRHHRGRNLRPEADAKCEHLKTETFSSDSSRRFNHQAAAPEKQQSQGGKTAADPATPGPDVVDEVVRANTLALVLAGIGEPTRSSLARRPGVSPALVERAATNLAGRGGSGLLVREIEALADQATAGPRSRSPREELQCRQQVEFAADREDVRQEQIRRKLATRELEGQFTEEECARAFQEYVQDKPERVRSQYADRTWHFSPQAVLEKLARGRLGELLAEGGDDGNQGQEDSG